MRKILLLGIGTALLLLSSWVPSGCTSKPSAAAPPPRRGVAEYRDIVAQALQAVAAALESVDRVGSQTDRCPPEVVQAFSNELQDLQVESLRLRARVKAVQARGDAYFANWEENMEQVKDPEVRALAEQRRPELQQQFARIKTATQEAGAVFRPLAADLRKLRVNLEQNPGVVREPPGRELINTIKTGGASLQRHLATINGELDSLVALVTPTDPKKH